MTPLRAVVCGAAVLAAASPAAGDRLPSDVVPLHYQLIVTPDAATATFDGDVTIDLRVDKPTAQITMHAVGLDTYWSELTQPGGRLVFPTVTADPAAQTMTFTLAARLLPGTYKLHVRYGGRLSSDGRGFGLVRAHGRPYVVSRMEPTGARRAFPAFDEPGVTASFAISAVVGDRLTAISNGKLLADTPGPQAGKHTLRFGTTPRMPSYLVALAVGEFVCQERDADGVPLRACTTPEEKDHQRVALDLLERAYRADSAYFTLRYPFRKLDLVAVPGGMEGAFGSTGAVVCGEVLLAELDAAPETARVKAALAIARGVARLWLGDVVSVRWWDDLWIVEGLAEWAAPKALVTWRPQAQLDLGAAGDASDAMGADALRTIRALRSPTVTEGEIEEAFDAWARQKSAGVFRALERWLGADVFRDSLNAFVRAKAFEAASAEDLWAQLSATSGQPVDRVLIPFATRAGVPLLAVDASCDSGETVVTVEQRRFGAGPAAGAADAAAWQIPLGIRGVGVDVPMLVVANHRLVERRQTFTLTGCFTAVIVNAGGTGYFRTRHSAGAFARLVPLARDRMTAAERLRFLDDAWALAGEGELSLGNCLALVQALATDATPEVVEAIAARLTFVAGRLSPGPARTRFEAFVAETFRPVAAGLGWRVAPGEAADSQRRRAAVLDILGSAGRDPAVLAAARALAAAAFSGGPPLHPSLAPVVARLAATAGDAALLGRLPALDSREAVAHAADASFVTRTLGSVLDSPDRRDRVAFWLSAAFENPAANAQAWQFLVSRWDDVQPRLAAPFVLASVVTAAGSFCDGAMREEVGRFFARQPAVPPRTLGAALDRIDACRDWRVRAETGMQ